jgi:hypothetical protein
VFLRPQQSCPRVLLSTSEWEDLYHTAGNSRGATWARWGGQAHCAHPFHYKLVICTWKPLMDVCCWMLIHIQWLEQDTELTGPREAGQLIHGRLKPTCKHLGKAKVTTREVTVQSSMAHRPQHWDLVSEFTRAHHAIPSCNPSLPTRTRTVVCIFHGWGGAASSPFWRQEGIRVLEVKTNALLSSISSLMDPSPRAVIKLLSCGSYVPCKKEGYRNGPIKPTHT